MKAKCKICKYVYDDSQQTTKFADLPDSWGCPLCGVPKSLFEIIEEDVVESVKEKSQTASDIVIKTLKDCGLKWVFGMVGHSNLGMADAIRKCSSDGSLNFVTIRHEGAGAFAASGYGKLTGRPAATLTIAGPGATNLMTGLYDAKLDRAPTIALTGQVPSSDMGQYVFQEVDLNSVFKDVAVSQQTMLATSDFSKLAQKAYVNALRNGGVSQIIMPDDIQTQVVENKSESVEKISINKSVAMNCDDFENISKALSGKKRPVILVGFGAEDCADNILTMAKKIKCPVALTYRAKGFIDETEELVCGVIGRSGTPVSSNMLAKADVVIAFGVGFSRHSAISTSADVIQIDNRQEALGRLYDASVQVLCDCSIAVKKIDELIDAQQFEFENQIPEILENKKEWVAEKSKRATKNEVGRLSPAFVCEKLTETVPSNAIVSVDVGNVAYSFGRYFEAKNQRFLLSWYLGSIGCGLPSAIGASCATKEVDGPYYNRKVVAIVGDGGLGQYLADFTTCVKYNLNICVVVFNNSELGKISLEQRAGGFNVWETSLVNPNFAEFANGCGAFAKRIENPDELQSALSQAMQLNGPSLIEVMTSSEQ